MRGRQDQKAASEVADASRRKTDLCSRCSLAASAMLAQGENALATLPSASTVILAQPPCGAAMAPAEPLRSFQKVQGWFMILLHLLRCRCRLGAGVQVRRSSAADNPAHGCKHH
ncbi:uncharacterized protein LOC142588152 isoform X1 [Dermacentor variabilis]|uniref:uncharacterized protein LOC142568265 isoform X1 n=1 Tax=Dermacentor variabilis TaxID=34621 RepID=UPI003F5B5AE7